MTRVYMTSVMRRPAHVRSFADHPITAIACDGLKPLSQYRRVPIKASSYNRCYRDSCFVDADGLGLSREPMSLVVALAHIRKSFV